MTTAAEFMLQSSDRFFRNLLEMAPDAMIIIDSDGKIVIVNSQVEQLFGYLREELYGEPLEMLLPERFRKRHMSYRAGYSLNPHVRPMGRDMTLAGLRRDGREFPVEISLSPVSTNGGSYVASLIRDVTDRKRMEAELIEARRIAERANKANSAFLAAASHDLRQPVQALCLLNGALRRTVDNPMAQQMIDSQQQSLDTMTSLLNSLLDITRLDAGAIKPRIETFPVQQLFDRLRADFSRQTILKGLELDVVQSSMHVESDPQLLAEIVQNFVSNAIRYTEVGTIGIRCEVDGDLAWLRVVDTGIGIEKQHFEDIFAESHQIRVAGRKSEGFGLGLAIVKRMADLMGHRVTVSSEPGKGSVFSIAVPVVMSVDAELPANSSPVPGVSAMSGLVLLIEDDNAVANALAVLLESAGFRVATAASANEAMAVARHLAVKPDLLISDYHLLDGSTGVQAIVNLREYFDDILPAFIVTGDTSIVVDEAKSLPNCLLIRKPVNPDSLLHDAGIAVENGEVPTNAHARGPA